jgi:TPR repeat protein
MKRSAGATKMKIFKYLAFSALLTMSVSGASAQDIDKGFAAYAAGDYQTAFKEFLPLAEGGDARAQYNLGLMYDNGTGVPQDYAEAVKWYRLAADQGNAIGRFNLGVMFNKGNGVIQNYVEAAKWYRLAADQGDAYAQSNLGVAYEFGTGVIQNNAIAHMWYNIASANGAESSPKKRDGIAAKMTPEAIEKAQAMAQECLNSGYKNCGD